MTTGTLCRMAGITEHQLRNMILSRKIEAPVKDATGRYVWPNGSVERVLDAFARDLRRRPQRLAVPLALPTARG